jgi:hypothetical protein
MLALLIVIAAAIRLIFLLLASIWPYLAAGLLVFAILRLALWGAHRW